MANEALTPNVRTLFTGLAIGEAPRWHAGRLWFCNWGTQQIVAVDERGTSQVIAHVPTDMPASIDWLPDRRLLMVSGRAPLRIAIQAGG
jgi:sugar lactone lactonase YvrE